MQNSNSHTFRRFLNGSAFALASVAALSLAGCLAGEDKDEPGSEDVFMQFESEIVATTPPTDSTPGSIVTHETEHECWDGVLETYEYDDTTHYVIGDGSMLLWSPGDCMAVRLSGSSSTVVGTWTTNDFAMSDSVPAGYRDPDCQGDDEEEIGEEFTALFEDVTATYTITDASITGTASGTICFGPVLASAYEESLLLEVISAGCSEVQIRSVLEEEKTATYSISLRDGEVTTTFSHAGKSCSMSVPFDSGNEPPQCAEEYATETAFEECIGESGFYPEFEEEEAEKKAASAGAAEVIREVMRKAASRLP